MKKLIAVLAVFSMIVIITGCKGIITEPDTPSGETVENASAQDVSNNQNNDNTGSSTETTTDAQTSTTQEPDTASYIKPQEQVTYSAEGIPIANAFFSLKLPADWDGHYLAQTNYIDDVMTLTFKEKQSTDAGFGGTVFSLALVPEGSEYNTASIKELKTLVDDEDQYTLCAVYPSDVQYTEQAKEQYNAMEKQVDDILKTLEPGPGFRFE